MIVRYLAFESQCSCSVPLSSLFNYSHLNPLPVPPLAPVDTSWPLPAPLAPLCQYLCRPPALPVPQGPCQHLFGPLPVPVLGSCQHLLGPLPASITAHAGTYLGPCWYLFGPLSVPLWAPALTSLGPCQYLFGPLPGPLFRPLLVPLW